MWVLLCVPLCYHVGIVVCTSVLSCGYCCVYLCAIMWVLLCVPLCYHVCIVVCTSVLSCGYCVCHIGCVPLCYHVGIVCVI